MTISTDIVVGPLAIDLDGKTITVEGRDVRLTRREWDVLAYLAGRIGKFCDLDELFWRVFAPDVIVGSRPSVDRDHHVRVTINRLRDKLGSARGLIEARPRFGYRLKDGAS